MGDRYAKKAYATRYNNTLSVLRHVLNVAIEAGVIYNNPPAAAERVPVRGKRHLLSFAPTSAKPGDVIAFPLQAHK
jgi:hypothetical protein